jgi:GNAT superfamily N-acetyltransferase
MLIRRANDHADVEHAYEIEKRCYPPDAAASWDAFVMRKQKFSNYFFIAEISGEVIGVTNGVRVEQPNLTDDGIKQAGEAAHEGAFFCVLTVAVDEAYRHSGIGTLLMKEVIKQARRDGLEAIVLMCEEHLIGFYEKLDFVYAKPSASTHGGIQWHEMGLKL